MATKVKTGSGVLQFVNVDPVEKPKLWPKTKSHKTKRFILVTPSSHSQLEQIKAFHQPPGGLLAVAAAVNKIRPDIECIIVDEAMDDYFPTDIEPDKDLVGITANTSEANFAYSYAVKLREKYPELPIVGGGPHFTFQTDEALHFFDAIILGEAEGILLKFLEDLSTGKLQSLYDGRKIPVNMDQPDFPILRPRDFLQKAEEYGSYFLLTSRGCNNSCIFCAEQAFSGHGIRYHNMDNVRRQIENTPKRPVIYLGDDNIMANRNRTIKLAYLLKEMGIVWLCNSNIAIGDDIELLKILGKCGCIMIAIGIESIEEKNLMSIGKARLNKPEKYEQQLKNIRNYGGMGILGEFMIWSDGFQYPDSLVRLADWIHKQKVIECIQMTIETPLPGTKLRQMRIKQDRLLTIGPYGKKISWDDYSVMNITQKIPGVTPEQAQGALHWLYGTLYGKKPSYTWRYLPQFMNTHLVHGKGNLKSKIISTIYPFTYHRTVNGRLKLFEMNTPDGKIPITSLQ